MPLDARTVRTWCRLALDALDRSREEIDAINVYPVADGDTGTNLYLTVESASQAVEAVHEAHASAQAHPSLAEALRAMSHGALIGARGNSGTILAQLLRGMNESLTGAPTAPAGPDEGAAPPGPAAPEQPVPGGRAGASGSAAPRERRTRDEAGGGVAPAGPVAAGPVPPARSRAGGRAEPAAGPDAGDLRLALHAAAESAYEAVAHPVEGTMLTVARAAAGAAGRAPDDLGAVARAAHAGARAALAGTPAQLGVLRTAGVVDAGGLGLVAVLAALASALTGEPLPRTDPPRTPGAEAGGVPESYPEAEVGPGPEEAAAGEPRSCVAGEGDGPAYEVIYLLEADPAAVPALRDRLDVLGDSLVVVGGDGLWNVHIHVDDVGAAIEAGIEAGRPYRIRVTHFGDHARRPARRHGRAVVALVRGDGMAALCRQAGATVLPVRAGEAPAGAEIAAAVRATRAREVILLPNEAELRPAAGAAAEQSRADGVRVALIPTRSAVQGIAALAVHEPSRRFDEDVVAMTSAAGATRYAELAVAEHESWTMAGVCQAGDVLGLIDGDVALIGAEVAGTAVQVLDRMLAAGGEMVTLVLGATAPAGLAALLEAHVRDTHLAVDTVTYEGGQTSCPLLIGVE